MNSSQEEPKRLAGYEIAIAVSLLAILGLCICAVSSSAGVLGYQARTQQRANETAAAFKAKTNSTATAMMAKHETATAIEESALATTRAEVQKYGFYEPFDDNQNKWDSENFGYGGLLVNFSIENGVFAWKISGYNKSYLAWQRNETQERLKDFDLSVNVKRINGSQNQLCYGYIFRMNFFDQGFYFFEVCDSQFAVRFNSSQTGWQQLIDWTESDAIRPGDWNRLEVRARGPHFVFLINNTVVGECDDDRIAVGFVYLAADVRNAKPGTIWFDDFALQNR